MLMMFKAGRNRPQDFVDDDFQKSSVCAVLKNFSNFDGGLFKNYTTAYIDANRAAAEYIAAEMRRLRKEEAEEADNIVRTRQTQAQGLLRVGSSVAFGRRVVTPHVIEFMKRHPSLNVELSFEDTYVDLVARGFDVALRMVRRRCCWWRDRPRPSRTSRSRSGCPR